MSMSLAGDTQISLEGGQQKAAALEMDEIGVSILQARDSLSQVLVKLSECGGQDVELVELLDANEQLAKAVTEADRVTRWSMLLSACRLISVVMLMPLKKRPKLSKKLVHLLAPTHKIVFAVAQKLSENERQDEDKAAGGEVIWNENVSNQQDPPSFNELNFGALSNDGR